MIICVYSVVSHLFIFQGRKDLSWMRGQGSASLLAIVRMNLAIKFTIMLRISLLETMMYNSWKATPKRTLIRWRR